MHYDCRRGDSCKSVSSIGGMIGVFWCSPRYWGGEGDDFKIPYLWILLCPNSCLFYSFSPDFS